MAVSLAATYASLEHSGLDPLGWLLPYTTDWVLFTTQQQQHSKAC